MAIAAGLHGPVGGFGRKTLQLAVGWRAVIGRALTSNRWSTMQTSSSGSEFFRVLLRWSSCGVCPNPKRAFAFSLGNRLVVLDIGK